MLGATPCLARSDAESVGGICPCNRRAIWTAARRDAQAQPWRGRAARRREDPAPLHLPQHCRHRHGRHRPMVALAAETLDAARMPPSSSSSVDVASVSRCGDARHVRQTHSGPARRNCGTEELPTVSAAPSTCTLCDTAKIDGASAPRALSRGCSIAMPGRSWCRCR